MKLLLEFPTHLRDLGAFALATGLRRANITELTWEQVSGALTEIERASTTP